MEILKRILLMVAGLSLIILFLALVLSLFLIIWPVVAIGTVALAAYVAIRSRFSSKTEETTSHAEVHETTIIIEHQEEDTSDN